MDFSHPPEVEQLRTESRAWPAANLTDDVVAAGRWRGKDDASFETLRAWSATMADAGWAAVSWPQQYLKRLLSWNAFRGGPDHYLTGVGARFVQSVVRRESTKGVS